MINNSFKKFDKPIITVNDFYGKQNKICDICIITFSKEIIKLAIEKFNAKKISEIKNCNFNIPIYLFEVDKLKIGIYVSSLGSAIASMNVIEANCLIGSDKFIMFGSAGSLDEEKTKNKYVIPTYSYRDEGMSYHYVEPEDYIKIENSKDVINIFDELKIPYVEGKIWTTDAIYMETVSNVDDRKKDGCIAVDMEVAGVQAVCKYYNFSLYNFLETGDVLSNDYTIDGLDKANHSFDKFYIGIEIAKRI